MVVDGTSCQLRKVGSVERLVPLSRSTTWFHQGSSGIFWGNQLEHAAFVATSTIYTYIFIYIYIFQIYRINILYIIDRYIFIHIYTYNTSSSITQSHAEKNLWLKWF